MASKSSVCTEQVCEERRVYNAVDVQEHLGVDATRLDELWSAARRHGRVVKLGGGFYCGLIDESQRICNRRSNDARARSRPPHDARARSRPPHARMQTPLECRHRPCDAFRHVRCVTDTFNAFFMSLRAQYTAPAASISFYEIQLPGVCRMLDAQSLPISRNLPQSP